MALAYRGAAKVEQRVQVSIVAAEPNFARLWGRIDPEILAAVRRLAPADPEPEGTLHDCPACGAMGTADGMEAEWENESSDERREDGAPVCKPGSGLARSTAAHAA